ncbi:hypothetical protein KDC22_18725 [Paenibacillus tritici]|uniref:hypothetical protein n=1 Tax=Paenibacillus tritici TaxID=1873425 RepID=UPI001BA6CBD3|nr:hypothetical protein [Paenibacillus tritici]QUL52488.1 hypothetical protein KDC22_18725 [Paenibacillus tritici]
MAQFLFPGESKRKVITDLLHAASGSLRICRLKFDEDGYSHDVCLHVHKDKTIITGLREEDAFGYELKEPEAIKRACHYLFNCFDYAHSRTMSAPALFLSKESYEEINDQAGGWTLCVLAESLGAETGDPDSSAELAKVLKHRTVSGELRLCSQDGGTWSLQEAYFLEAASGAWLLRSCCKPAQDYIIAFPLTRAELCHAFAEWLLHSTGPISP